MAKPAGVYDTILVDDNEHFLDGMSTYLKKYSCINIVGKFTDGNELIRQIDSFKFNLVFMDLQMPVIDGDQMTKIIMQKYSTTKVIGLSMYDDGHSVKRMLESGAWAFATKDYIHAKMPEIIEQLLKEKRYVDPKAAVNYALYKNKLKKKTAEIYVPQSANNGTESSGEIPDINLTPCEKKVIGFLVQGFTHKEIAKKLSRSSRTIDAHQYNIKMKLNAHKATEIVSLAYKYKLI